MVLNFAGFCRDTAKTHDRKSLKPNRKSIAMKSYAEWQREHQRYLRAIAKVLLRRRQAARLTQAQLAALAGISTSEIQHLEGAARDPRSGTLKRISMALGISLTELTAEFERVDRELERAEREVCLA